MFKEQECHKTLSNHSLILEKQVLLSGKTSKNIKSLPEVP